MNSLLKLVIPTDCAMWSSPGFYELQTFCHVDIVILDYRLAFPMSVEESKFQGKLAKFNSISNASWTSS